MKTTAPRLFGALLLSLAWLGGPPGAQAGVNVWTTSGPSGVTVYAVAVDPQTPTTLYAATSRGGGVFKSTDGGGSWTAANAGLTIPFTSVAFETRSLAIDPLTPTTLYVGTRETDRSTYKSTDGGDHWSNVSFADEAVPALAIDPAMPTTVYAGAASWVFKSTNGGGSWARSTLLTGSVDALAIDPVMTTTVYAGTAGGGVLKSADGGVTWVAVNAGLTNLTVHALAIDPLMPTILYAGTDGGVFKSIDAGGTWSAVNTGLTNLTVSALTIDPLRPTTLYAGTQGGGVFKSTDGGGVWIALNIGLTDLRVNALAIDPQTPTTVYAGTPAGIFTLQQTNPLAAVSARVEEIAATLAPSESWYETSSASSGVKLSGDRAVLAQAPGATATFTFTGTGVRWIGVPCEVCGIADVLIDGARVTMVDTYAPARPAASTTMYTSPPLAAGTHTIVISVTGDKSGSSGAAFVVVDAFDIMVDGASLVPTAP